MPHLGDNFSNLTECHPHAPTMAAPTVFHGVGADAGYQSCHCACQCGCACCSPSRKGSDAFVNSRSSGAVSEALAVASPDAVMSTSGFSSRRSSVDGSEGATAAQADFIVEASDLGTYDLRTIERMINRYRYRYGAHQLSGILPSDYGMPASPYISPACSGILSPQSVSVEPGSSGPQSMASSVSHLNLSPLGSPALAGMGAGVAEPSHQHVFQLVLIPLPIAQEEGDYPMH